MNILNLENNKVDFKFKSQPYKVFILVDLIISSVTTNLLQT